MRKNLVLDGMRLEEECHVGVPLAFETGERPADVGLGEPLGEQVAEEC